MTRAMMGLTGPLLDAGLVVANLATAFDGTYRGSYECREGGASRQIPGVPPC